MAIYRVYSEKKKEYAVEAAAVLSDLRTVLQLNSVRDVRILNRYDLENIERDDFEKACATILSEPQLDKVSYDFPILAKDEKVFAVEFLPGQYDQRADSAAQCIQFLTHKERPIVRTAKLYLLSGTINDSDFEKIKGYIINPVDSREADLKLHETLVSKYVIPEEIETLTGFTAAEEAALSGLHKKYGLAMDMDDLKFCQAYFRDEEKRDPTLTELRVIDTYWSDHCRHTTFLTNIENVSIDSPAIKKTYDKYLSLREELYAVKRKPVTLMDLATIGQKALRKSGLLKNLDESEEINACSVKIKVDVDGEDEDWLLMFKNETHNHPTEIEPFGGAATCLGGAIRDPLSGRSYVYQAMRVTGASDPCVPVEKTMKGKLPQRKIVTTAAAGYSAYGNQIGLSTGQVSEIYHDGYAAKHMEIGAVLGAAPARNIRREIPKPGDLIILLGGRTGRDGCGGATGSSKAHTLESIESCGAEVQKGNPPEERKIQRLFRKSEVTRLIKRCNDFGAGGVCVAIGELADGLCVNLNKVTKKYEGLDGTELAISESQERMAVVVDRMDAETFIREAGIENLEATVVAEVKETPRLVMNWNDKKIVSLSRTFLNSNGAKKFTDVKVPAPAFTPNQIKNEPLAQRLNKLVTDPNICSQKGLSERFDSTIGAGTVLMPFGGRTQLTPNQAMACKLPVLKGETETVSLMSWGYNPMIASGSPYHGALFAIVESVAKIVATGGKLRNTYLTLQEYFERTNGDPLRWGKPFSALLGALEAQLSLGVAAIGGKDSMSGSFEDIDVPPTLVSFAVAHDKCGSILSPEFKKPGSIVYLLTPEYNADGLPDFDSLKKVLSHIESLNGENKLQSVWTIGFGGVMEGIFKMSLGNQVGFRFSKALTDELLYQPCYGGFLYEADTDIRTLGQKIGETVQEYTIVYGAETADLTALQNAYEGVLSKVYPYLIDQGSQSVPRYTYKGSVSHRSENLSVARPRVLIPVFPGSNCEYDTARAFERAGAEAEIFVVRNLSAKDIEEAVSEFSKRIERTQIIAIPGGFSGGDEPEGSGKFITSFFRNGKVKEAVSVFLNKKDGLMCGICNGFQALIKLGLVPYGEIVDTDETSPTLTFNKIARHQSMLVRTRISSNLSPWLMHCPVGEIYTVPVSHGEGRFVGSAELIEKLAKSGQIATQYVDLEGNPTMDIRFNPNASICAIEAITSPDGRVFGKMAHSERAGKQLYKNVEGNKYQDIFLGAVDYFK